MLSWQEKERKKERPGRRQLRFDALVSQLWSAPLFSFSFILCARICLVAMGIVPFVLSLSFLYWSWNSCSCRRANGEIMCFSVSATSIWWSALETHLKSGESTKRNILHFLLVYYQRFSNSNFLCLSVFTWAWLFEFVFEEFLQFLSLCLSVGWSLYLCLCADVCGCVCLCLVCSSFLSRLSFSWFCLSKRISWFSG